MKKSTAAVLVLTGVLVLAVAPTATYYLPSTALVQINGTEVKRSEAGPKDVAPEDVRYVLARDAKTKDPLVFRNTDTRWSWPPYFKFDSADLSSAAMEISRSKPDATVLVTYYGVRSSVLDTYPNVVALKEVPADYSHVPVFNIVFITVLAGLYIALLLWIRRSAKRVGAWWSKKQEPAPAAEEPPSA